MDKLNYELQQLCKHNKDGSFATQNNRHRMLQLSANQLKEEGYRKMGSHSLKPKHIESLVGRWKAEGISSGTIKNRMATLRWWSEKVNKPGVIKRDNNEYSIENRTYVSNESKARTLPQDNLNSISNALVTYSLKLQKQFGLRREESIKFNVVTADKNQHLELKSSWTKGGRGRIIPINTAEQRYLLNDIKSKIGNRALIPDDRTYKQQMKTYEWHVKNAGLDKMHGLRHAYAQSRYKELTGWNSPAAGGLSSQFLSEGQKTLDRQVRLLISKELGHEREEITAVYLGR